MAVANRTFRRHRLHSDPPNTLPFHTGAYCTVCSADTRGPRRERLRLLWVRDGSLCGRICLLLVPRQNTLTRLFFLFQRHLVMSLIDKIQIICRREATYKKPFSQPEAVEKLGLCLKYIDAYFVRQGFAYSCVQGVERRVTLYL